MSTADEIRAERALRLTTHELIESSKATPQQVAIDDAVFELEKALAAVPRTTAHYAVEGLRVAIQRYRHAPPIKTSDA